MELTVRERLIISSILPQEGDTLTLRILRKLQENLSFSEEEIKLYKFESLEGERVRWDNTVEQEREIEIGEKATDIIVLALSKLNEQKKLKMEHLDIYDRFIEKK